ncbi:MAG: hypothetical protein NTZ20_05650 [Candidatus Levybacteria bacterium]|nr:hypothetical protein [Candidatus Levybacteria bacterium]
MPHKVKDNINLLRLDDSNAIINTDSDSLRLYKIKRENDRKLNRAYNDYEMLKSELGEIKNLLLKVLEKNS